MLNFFQSIIEYLQLLFNYAWNMISSISTFFSSLLASLVLPQILTGYVFAPLGAAITMVVATATIKLIIGRQ